jgi:hypothetical protein
MRCAFDALADAGIPMSESILGRPMLGVKCGCNEAFVLSVTACDGDLAHIRSNGSRGVVEAALLRPVLRGGGVTPWRIGDGPERLLWTHDEHRRPLSRLPEHAARWLASWRHELTARTDARATDRWWSLYRTEAAVNDLPRVVWSDFGKSPRAAVLPGGDRTIPLNSCYVARCESEDDAFALVTLLNSPIAAAWLNALAEPARGGFHRYLAWTVALLPIPANWARARTLLAPIARAAIQGDSPPFDLLVSEVARAYELSASTLAPLING